MIDVIHAVHLSVGAVADSGGGVPLNILIGATAPEAPAASAGWASSDLFKSLVAPAVIAVFFTGVTNFALERLKNRREAITGLSNALRDDLSALMAIGSEYWSSPADVADALKEAKIMASLEAVSAGLRSFQYKRGAKLAKDIDKWLVTLRDHLTGGEFQTAGRRADFARIQSASAQISKMRHKVFEERLRRL